MKDCNWSYLAGLFDGEGCIHLATVNFHTGSQAGHTGYRLDMHITMTSLEIVKWLVAHVGGVYYTVDMHNPNWKVAYRWVPKGKKNKENMILGMLPYLIVKREIALLALEFLRLEGICPEIRQELADKARLLTRRGKSVETNTLGAKSDDFVKIEPELMGDHESALVVTQAA